MDVRVARTRRLGLRALIGDAGASFHRMKTWKASKDPEYQVKQARVEHLYAIADGEFGPLDLMPGRAAGPPILPAPLTTKRCRTSRLMGRTTPTTPGYVR
jgi:hypothetical protein